MACTAEYYIIDNDIKTTDLFDLDVLKKGFSVYEVIKISAGVPLFLEDHIERLHASTLLKGEKVWCTDDYIRIKVNKIISVNKIKKGRLKFALRFHKSGNKFICFFLETIQPPEKDYIKGIKIISENYERLNPNAKVINYKLRKKLKALVKYKKVYETLLVNNSGKITECSKSNIFFIKDNRIYTSFSKDVLIGITRTYVFNICKNTSVPITETDIYYDDLKEYDSVFITGTSIGILAVIMIDEIKFSRDNAIFNKISDSYKSIRDKYIIDTKKL